MEINLTSKEKNVWEEIKTSYDKPIFSFEDLAVYGDYSERELNKILKSLDEKGLIEYSPDNKYGLIKK